MADLRYKVVVDDAEAKRKLADLLKGTGVSGSDGGATTATSSTNDLRAATLKLKDAQLANMEAMKKAREERAAQLKAQAELNAKLTEGRITAQQYALEQKKITAEEKKRAKEARELKKQLAENSEYAKLTKALNNVRKETKDVLSEMYQLERQGKKNSLGYQDLANRARGLVVQTNLLDSAVKKIDATVGQHQRNVGNYSGALENMIPIIGRVETQLGMMGTSLDELSQKGGFNNLIAGVTNLGKSMLAFIATPAGAAIAGLASLFALVQANKQTVIDFDSGMKNVAKTTGMAGSELSMFGDAVIELSAKLQVVSTDKLLEYATVAGQLGVKGRADILAFAESLAMLETASDISGEEGGAQIARMLTLVDGGVQNVKAFGDEIVNLGNNFAATEAEILDNATQISQNVGIYRIGRQDVLAFATATKAVGLEAELVGSTFSRTLGEFERTMRTGKGVSDLLKVIGGNQSDLERKFRDNASGVFVDYIRGLNNIHKAGGSVNEALERTGIIAVRDQRVIASLATNGYDVLTDAIDAAKNANGAMQTEFENGASKLQQQINRLSIAWDNFVLSIENGEGAIAGVFLRLIDGASILIDTINKAFNPTSLDEFTTRLFNIKAADKIREINLAMKEGESTVGKIGAMDLSKASQKQINELAKETESSLKSVTGALAVYRKEVEKGDLKDGGKNSIASAESTQKMLASQLGRLKLFAKEETKVNKQVEFDQSESEKRKAERSANAAKRAGERAAESRRQAVERQRSLQGQIDAINDQTARKQMSRDEEEIESVRDKYAKIEDEIRKFYDNPKNAGLKVDQGGLASSRRFEENEVRTRQETVKLVENLNQQRDIYASYNDYVEQNGVEAAEKMFGKQAELAREYRATLQREYTAITTLHRSASAMAFTGIDVKLTQAQEERAKALKAMLDALDKEDQAKARERYANALRLAETFTKKELSIRKEHADAVKSLGDSITAEQKAALDKGLQEQLTNLIESSPEFVKAMEDIDLASKALLGNAFRTGKDAVIRLIDGMSAATEEEKAKLRKIFAKFFNEGAKNADQGLYENIANVGSEFSNLVNQAFQFNKELDGGVGSLGAMVSSAAKLASTIADVMGEVGGSLSKAGGPAAVIGAFMQVVSGLVTGIQQAQRAKIAQVQAEADANHDRQMRATEAMTRALEIQLELIENIYGADRLAKYASSLSEIINEYTKLNDMLSGRYAMTGDTYIDGILKSLNEGKTKKQIYNEIADQYSNISYEFLNAHKIFNNLDKYLRLDNLPKDITRAREELARLQRDIALNGVDEKTQAIINQLEKQIELYEQTANKLKEERTGNAFSQVLSDVSTLFLNEGKDAGKAWTEGFNKIMENYMMQKFSREFLQERMQGWYDLLDDLSEGGITSSERDQLASEWDKIKEQGQQRIDQMKDVLGLESLGSSGSLESEGIQRMTEETGTEIVGMFRSGYDIWKQQLTQLQLVGKSQVDYVGISNAQLAQLNSININTAATVARLDTAVGHLQNIDKNLGGRYV